MADATPVPTSQTSSRAATALRWLLVLGIVSGGGYLSRRWILKREADAAARVAILDYARFAGCLLGAPMPTNDLVSQRLLEMARGSGDELWPYTCAQPLTRMLHETEALEHERPDAKDLARRVREMDSALGEGVYWTRHIQAGKTEEPAWGAFWIRLRAEVERYAGLQQLDLPGPELPAKPRIPRGLHEAPPPPKPEELPGGFEADVMDGIATPREAAVLLRDRKSRYSICTIPQGSDQPSVTCNFVDVPLVADPRYAAFVPSDQEAHVAIWARAPRSIQGLVQPHTRRVRLLAGGNPVAARDFWVGPEKAMAVQIDASGPALLVDDELGTRELALPPQLDVLSEDRSLLGSPQGAMLVFLEAEGRDVVTLRSMSLGHDADRLGAIRSWVTFRTPRFTSVERLLLPCHVPSGGSWLILGDKHSTIAYHTQDGKELQRVAELPHGANRETKLACDAEGLELAFPGEGGFEAYQCTATTCWSYPSTFTVNGDYSIARSRGNLLIADNAGENHRLRIRRVEPSGLATEATLRMELPSARSPKIVAAGDFVVVFAAATQTTAVVSHNGAQLFEPVSLAPPPEARADGGTGDAAQ